jgi:hypothetical protein
MAQLPTVGPNPSPQPSPRKPHRTSLHKRAFVRQKPVSVPTRLAAAFRAAHTSPQRLAKLRLRLTVGHQRACWYSRWCWCRIRGAGCTASHRCKRYRISNMVLFHRFSLKDLLLKAGPSRLALRSYNRNRFDPQDYDRRTMILRTINLVPAFHLSIAVQPAIWRQHST